MTTLGKLKLYEKALREWRRKMNNGKSSGPEPDPVHYQLVRVEEVFVAKRLREQLMNENV